MPIFRTLYIGEFETNPNKYALHSRSKIEQNTYISSANIRYNLDEHFNDMLEINNALPDQQKRNHLRQQYRRLVFYLELDNLTIWS